MRPDEVTFTASGTDAVHRGLLGLHRARRRHGTAVLHSAVEHSAVRHALRWAEAPSIEVPVTADRPGEPRGSPEALSTAGSAEDTEPAAVAAVQHANHEVGTVHPVAEIAGGLGDVPLFLDACASAGRVPLPDGWSAAAASAHKWGGPAGVGLLLVRKGARWRNPFPEDDRVDPRSAGFENVPAALAAAAALQAMVAEQRGARRHGRRHWWTGYAGWPPRCRTWTWSVSPSERLPHLVTFSCLYVEGEALVTELDRLGFGVASGSACTASTLEPSHVLAAMGALTHGNVRLSLTRACDEPTVDSFLAALPGVIERLRREVGM